MYSGLSLRSFASPPYKPKRLKTEHSSDKPILRVLGAVIYVVHNTVGSGSYFF